MASRRHRECIAKDRSAQPPRPTVPEEPEGLEGPEEPDEHNSMVYQMTQSVATGGHGQPSQRMVDRGARGTKRQEIHCETPPNTKWRKTKKGGKGLMSVLTEVGKRVKAKGMASYSGAAGKLVAKRTDTCGQNPSDQQQDQEDFHNALNDLRARHQTRETAFSGAEEPSERTQEDPQAPGPKGL